MAKKDREQYKERIIEKAKEGMNLSNIAILYNLNRLDVKLVMKEAGLYIPRKRYLQNIPELREQSIELYKAGKSLKEIEEITSIPRKEVSKILKENNIILKDAGFYNREHALNHNFFSEYSPVSVYMAGFIAGDGCVFEKGGGVVKGLTITLQATDTDHLQSLANNLEFSGNLYKKEKSSTLTLNSEQICADLLEKYNITPRKTYSYIPPNNIPSHLVKYFILGLLDSDGTITRSKRQPRKTSLTLNRGDYVYQMGFTGTLEVCEYIKNFFGSSVKIHTRHPDRNNNNYTILFQGNKQVYSFCQELYDEQSILFCLQRKYKKFLLLAEEYGRLYWKQCGL